MKWSAKIVLVANAVLAFALTLPAEPVSQLRPTDYVNDLAQVLDSATIAQLDDICRQIDSKAHVQIAVVTIKSLDGSDIESYAVDLYKKWGVGSKSSNKGVLILLAVQDRKYRIEVGYGLEPILPDGKVGGFGREAVPLLKQGDYDGAVSLMVSRVADVIAQDAGVQLAGAPPATAPRESDSHNDSFDFAILVPVIFVIVVLTFLLRGAFENINREKRGKRRGGFFGGWHGGGWSSGGGFGGGSWGGGGSGGGGSGGGFGGFGGGSSGGGGASGSW